MSGCRILGDAAVHKLLIELSKSDIGRFQQAIGESLRQYSVAEERKYQPQPGVINRPTGSKILFRPFTSPTAVGTKIVVDPAPDASGKKQGLHGAVVVCDNNGLPIGLLNAEEITGFRTSMSAIIPWTYRVRTETILVYGAGKQALWHLRLALALRGDEIKCVTIVNRSIERTQNLIKQLKEDNDARWKSKAEITIQDPSDVEGTKSKLSQADVVFCTVPSQKVLFSVQDLALESRQHLPYISAIGSWQPNMIELDPELLTYASSHEKTYHPSGNSNGVILVDDRDSVLGHTGEGVQSGLKAEQILELGEVLDLQKSGNQSQQLLTWLQEGLVVYKSVGVSLTDLATSEAILKQAKERDLGMLVSDL